MDKNFASSSSGKWLPKVTISRRRYFWPCQVLGRKRKSNPIKKVRNYFLRCLRLKRKRSRYTGSNFFEILILKLKIGFHIEHIRFQKSKVIRRPPCFPELLFKTKNLLTCYLSVHKENFWSKQSVNCQEILNESEKTYVLWQQNSQQCENKWKNQIGSWRVSNPLLTRYSNALTHHHVCTLEDANMSARWSVHEIGNFSSFIKLEMYHCWVTYFSFVSLSV